MTYREKAIYLIIMWIILAMLSAGITVLYKFDKSCLLGGGAFISWMTLIGTTVGIYNFINNI